MLVFVAAVAVVSAATRAVERQQQCAVVQVLRPGDEPLDLVRTEDHRQPIAALGIRQVLMHVPSPQHMATEEPQRAHVRDDGLDGNTALCEEGEVIAPDRVRTQPIEAATSLPAKVLDDADVATGRDRGILASHELVVQPLQELGHRQYLLRPTLLPYELPGCPSAAAPAASFQSLSGDRSSDVVAFAPPYVLVWHREVPLFCRYTC